MTAVLIERENEEWISVKFEYDQESVEKIRKIHGRKWNLKGKFWSVPNIDKTVIQLLDIFQDGELFIDATLSPFSVKPDQNQTKNYSTDKDVQIMLNLDRELKIRSYSPKTRKAYRNQVKVFKLFTGGGLSQITEKQILDYLFYLVDKKQVSESYIDQTVSAIKFI